MSGSSPTSDRQRLEGAEVRRRVCELRVSKLSWRAIAAEMEMSVAGVYDAWKKALAEIPKEAAEESLAGELESLDIEERRVSDIQDALAHGMAQGDLRACELTLKAIETKLHVKNRRARYLGLDAPEKIESTLVGGPTTADAARIVREVFGAVTPDTEATDDADAANPT